MQETAAICLWVSSMNVEEHITDETFWDGFCMSATIPREAPPRSAQEGAEEGETHKARCLCGKWWAYRSGDTLILRCKLCRRDILVTGENLKITYR